MDAQAKFHAPIAADYTKRLVPVYSVVGCVALGTIVSFVINFFLIRDRPFCRLMRHHHLHKFCQ